MVCQICLIHRQIGIINFSVLGISGREGAHFVNWLEQYREVYGEKYVKIEEIDSKGFSCFELGKEKMFRIWVKENK